MDDRYRLVGLGNEQLLAALKGLVRRENFALADMLAHLAELDERQLFLELGYSSLFAYCTEALGFCKSSAGRRIAAARVCRNYPESFSRVARGELQLSVLSVLRPHLTADSAPELFDACRGKSFEQVEELLAARFPRPDVRDSIRRLPDATRRTPDVGSAMRHPVSTRATLVELSMVAELSTVAMGAVLLENQTRAQPAEHASAKPAPAAERIEPLSPDRFGVHFTADAEFRELLEEVRALASHQQPKGELLLVMKRALEAYRRELRKKRFAVGAKPRRPAESRTTEELELKRARRASAAVRRAVYERDCGECTFTAQDGRRCGARQFLELDHVEPWARRGASTVDNLRLRCRAHNQYTARTIFGSAHMRAAVERAQSTRRDRQDHRTERETSCERVGDSRDAPSGGA